MSTDNINQGNQLTAGQQPQAAQPTALQPPQAAVQPPAEALPPGGPPPGAGGGGADGGDGSGGGRTIRFWEGVGNIVLRNLGPILTVIVVGVSMFGVGYMIKSAPIDDPAYARGIITVLFSVGTIAIAIVLILSATFLNDADKKERFDRGKEVLSLLLGIFGTIVGFYYGTNQQGSATDKTTHGANTAQGAGSAPVTPPPASPPDAKKTEEAKEALEITKKADEAKNAQDTKRADEENSVQRQKRTNQQ
jgi:hypothetical protein